MCEFCEGRIIERTGTYFPFIKQMGSFNILLSKTFTPSNEVKYHFMAHYWLDNEIMTNLIYLHSSSLEVFYCPFCGKKLGEVDNTLCDHCHNNFQYEEKNSGDFRIIFSKNKMYFQSKKLTEEKLNFLPSTGYKNFILRAVIQFNYCPFCGRRL